MDGLVGWDVTPKGVEEAGALLKPMALHGAAEYRAALAQSNAAEASFSRQPALLLFASFGISAFVRRTLQKLHGR